MTRRKKFLSVDMSETKRKQDRYQGSGSNTSQQQSRNNYDETFEIVDEINQRASNTGRNGFEEGSKIKSKLDQI